MSSFFQDDKTRTEAASVEASTDLPVAYIYNDKDGRGANGGLFINLRDLPPDIQINKEFVREFSTEHPDRSSPTGVKTEAGILLPHYRLVLVAFDHNNQGQSQAWQQRSSFQGQDKDKWVFYAIAGVWEAWSQTRPFRIKYGGATNSIGMSTHVRNFDRYIVGEATAIIKRNDANAPGASRNQFLLPVSHAPRLVGVPPNQSWACPVVEYESEGLRVDANGRRSGVSTLKKFADDQELLKQLFIPKLEGGRERALKVIEWIETYKNAVKVTDMNQAATDSEHFTENEKESIDEDQIKRINDLAAQAGLNVEQEIQVLRGSNVLKGGDNVSNILTLSKTGARLMINHLTEALRNKQTQAAQAQAPAAPKSTPFF